MMDVEKWQKVIDTNLNGTFYVCKAVGKQMIKKRKLVAAIAAQPKILEPELPPLGGVLENHAPASTIHNAPT